MNSETVMCNCEPLNNAYRGRTVAKVMHWLGECEYATTCALRLSLQRHATQWGYTLTLWKIRVWAQGGGGGWPPLSHVPGVGRL